MVGAPCTGSQILLTTWLAKRTESCRRGAHHRESLAQDLEVPFEEPGSCPDWIPGRLLGALTFPAAVLAGHSQRVGFSCFLFNDLSPSRGPQMGIKTRTSWRVGGKKLFLIHSSGRVWLAPF